jgi:hypothetical protein
MWYSSNNCLGLSVSQNTGRGLVIPWVSRSSYGHDSLGLAASDEVREVGPFYLGHYLCDLHQFSLKGFKFRKYYIKGIFDHLCMILKQSNLVRENQICDLQKLILFPVVNSSFLWWH